MSSDEKNYLLTNDPMIDHGKHLEGHGCCPTFPKFLVNIFLGIPAFIMLLIFTFILRLFMLPFACCCSKRGSSSQRRGTENDDFSEEKQQEEGKSTPPAERPLDIVIFGATGFTGKLAVEYMTSTYGSSKIKWGIAGRKFAALQQVRNDMCNLDPSMTELTIIEADSFDEKSLRAMVQQTRVVATCVGPFARYGQLLVKVCAETGTHYCDITGETDFARDMIDLYDDTARANKAQIVHFCGHDCIPWDLMVFSLANEIKKQSGGLAEELAQVEVLDYVRVQGSGGTISTYFNSLEREKTRHTLGFDPLLKSPSGGKSDYKVRMNNTSCCTRKNGQCVGMFEMATVNGNCVRRSNAINTYGSRIDYVESRVHPNCMAAFNHIMGLAFVGLCIINPVWKKIMQSCCLPQPGQGPSQQVMDQGFLKLYTRCTGENGTSYEGVMFFKHDPGYKDTALMLIESALSLALCNDHDDNNKKYGVLTPAAAVGNTLLERLKKAGVLFSMARAE